MPDSMDLDSGFAEGWRPNEGDRVVGRVVDVDSGWSDYTSSNYPIITVHDEETDKDVALHCFHHVLKKEVLKYKPQIGERIGVVYKGKVDSKDGLRKIATYVVKVEGRTGTAVYDNMEPTAPANNPQPVATTTDSDDIPF